MRHVSRKGGGRGDLRRTGWREVGKQEGGVKRWGVSESVGTVNWKAILARERKGSFE